MSATIGSVEDDLGVALVHLVVNDVLTKNERHRAAKRAGHASIILSDRAVAFRGAVKEAADLAGVKIASGRWDLRVVTTWPTQRHLDVDFAHGDADAGVSSTQDALQHAGVIDDDVRIIESTGSKTYDKGQRKTEAWLTRRP